MKKQTLIPIVIVILMGVISTPAQAMRRGENPVMQIYEKNKLPEVQTMHIKETALKTVETMKEVNNRVAIVREFSPPPEKKVERELDRKITVMLDPRRGPDVDPEDIRNQINRLPDRQPDEKMVRQYLSMKLELVESTRRLRELTQEYDELNEVYVACTDASKEMSDASIPMMGDIASLTKYLRGAGGAGIVALLGLAMKWKSFLIERKLKKLDIRIRTVHAIMEERKLPQDNDNLTPGDLRS
jgi:hypothetical protein